MASTKSADRPSLQTDSINTFNNNALTKSVFNPDFNHIKQDLLFFKNDILKDLRKIEEKVNLKLTEQTVVNNEQYEAYEKKLDFLTTKITHVDTIVSDNSFITEKLNTFQSFKSKAEDNFYTLNSRMFNFQKESKESLVKIEKMLEENLKYPGIIGRNSKFSNFRFFIDFVMKNIKLLNDFKEEIQAFDFSDYKKRINTDLLDFRFAMNENYKNSRRLAEKNMKDFDDKLEELKNNNNRRFEDNEDKLQVFKNKVYEHFSEYEKQINLLEKNFNQKFNEQLNEINMLKNMKNKFMSDIEDIKNNLSKHQKYLEYIKNITERNLLLKKMDDNNTNYIRDNKIYLGENNKDNKLDSDLNIIDNRDSDEKTLSDNTLEHYAHMRMNKINLAEYSKSFDKTQNNEISLKHYYSDDHNEFKNTKGSMAFTQDDFFHERERVNNILNLKNKKIVPKMNLNRYYNIKKGKFPNNYSITKIANIKVKQVLLPESLNNRNKIIKTSKSSSLDNKDKRAMSNNNPTQKKFFLQNSENIINTNTLNKKIFSNDYSITKISKQKNTKMRGIKFIESARFINRRPESKKVDTNVNSVFVVQTKTKNNILNSVTNLRKNKLRNWSFEKIKKDEKTQIGFRNTFYTKNQFNELLLINAKNLKKNRKIKI